MVAAAIAAPASSPREPPLSELSRSVLSEWSSLVLVAVDRIGVCVAPVSLVTAGDEEMTVGTVTVSSGDETEEGVLVLLKLPFPTNEGSEGAFHQLSRDIVDLGKTVVLPAEDISVESAFLTGAAGAGARRVNDRAGNEFTAAVLVA